MSDAKEKGDRLERAPESPAPTMPDAQDARVAGAAELASAERQRTNASDGSLRKYSAEHLAAQEQSIELVYGDRTASRKDKRTERELLLDIANKPENVDTQGLARVAKDTSLPEDKRALASMIQDMRSQSKAHSTPTTAIDDYAREALKAELAASHKPAHGAEDQNDCGSSFYRPKNSGAPEILQGRVVEEHQAEIQPSSTSNAWLEAGRKIAALPLDKQAVIIGTGLLAGMEQYQHEENERKWGAIIGTVQGLGKVAENLAKMADFSAYCIIGDQERAGRMGEEFGTAIGQSYVAGIKVFQGAQKYSYDVGYTGDYVKPVRDLLAVGKLLDDHWSQLPPREQERLKYELISQMAADAVIGSAGAQALGKAKTFTGMLDAVAEEAAKHGRRTYEVTKKTIQTISNVTQEVLGPELSAAGVGKTGRLAVGAEEAASDIFAMERRVYVSKYDSTHRLRPIEAARENARVKGESFDEEAWKKLKPEEKQEVLVKDGYTVLENPEPRLPIDSTKIELAYRGDSDLYSPLDFYGKRKSYINADGDLVPASLEGKFNGKPVTIEEHVLGSRHQGAKNNSPYISIGTNGVIQKYGNGLGIAVDMIKLRRAIDVGEVAGVEIIEHSQLIEQILRSDKKMGEKMMALNFARKDNEFLIKGVVPNRFLKPLGE